MYQTKFSCDENRAGIVSSRKQQRGSEGEWLGAYAKKIGIGSAYLEELWGMYEGLLLVRRMGFQAVDINVDSKVVVEAVSSGARL
ncbi:ribonuclease H [Trifolium medium]|uniref:Ribonuclease H n=1 Tax=Trifolium medium TaxID=97028 RepID=A0A392QH52_9FABA|nr:ribonuclease H [Trifolium medium]